MKHRIAFINLPLLAVFLVLASTAALASNTWYVDGVHGSDGNNCKSHQTACKTIGHAILLAASGDSIMVAAATYTENLTIGISLRILGASASTTGIDGGGLDTVITISSTAAHVSLSGVSIQGGSAPLSAPLGGGINNGGTLTINNSAVIGNYASTGGGGIYNNGTLKISNSVLGSNHAGTAARCVSNCKGMGGGILNSGTLTINNSTLNGNYAVTGGGGIYNLATLRINNSTLSENVASRKECTLHCYYVGDGGGIWNGGPLTINNSTLTGNHADDEYVGGGGGIYNNSGPLTINNSTLSGNSAARGGGIFGVATLQNSIVANNSRGNCDGMMISNGYNLSSDNTCNFNSTGDMNNTDPVLGTLGNHGGPTQTIPLRAGSPAIDAGNPNGCTDGNGNLLKTDQRGRPRPDKEDKGGCDMGAYERQKD